MVPHPSEKPDEARPSGGLAQAGPDRVRFIGETYRILFEKNPMPMWVYDCRTLRFLAVNEAAVTHYGYSRDEFLRLTIRDIRPPEDLPDLERELGRLDSLTESIGLWRHVTKDGRILDVEVRSNEIDFNRHRARLVLAEDVTDRVRTERRLRTGYAVARILGSETTFREAVPKMLRAICEEAGWEYGELWRVGAEREALRWEGAWRIAGFPSADFELASADVRVERGAGVPGKTWATGRPEWLTDLTPRAHFARVEAAGRLGLQQALSFPIKGHRGRVIGVLVFFSREVREPDEGFLELMEDLGNRMGQFLEEEALETERRRIEERFMKAFYQNPAASVISRLDGSRIFDVNESFARLFGYAREEVVGRSAAEVGILEHVDERMSLLEPLTRGESVHGVETTFRTKGGTILTGLLSSERLQMGAEPTILTTIVDVTDLRAAQEHLMEAERLASIGETAAFVAHEINTPLANISLLTAAIHRDTDESKVRERLEKIDVQRRLASRIINEILAVARPAHVNREPTDLVPLVRMATDQAAMYRGPQVALELDVGEVPVMASVDPLRMQQVFVNLIKNAYQATERGSVRVSLHGEGDAATLTVADTGMGIPESARERIFMPFYTTKGRGQGAGLGLAFVRTVVGAHEGQVEFDSEVGRGTTFRVTLPKASPGPGDA